MTVNLKMGTNSNFLTAIMPLVFLWSSFASCKASTDSQCNVTTPSSLAMSTFDAGYSYYAVVISSICSQEKNSSVNLDALLHHLAVKHAATRAERQFYYGLASYDVCVDNDKLIALLTSLMLSSRYQTSERIERKTCYQCPCVPRASRILSVFLHLPEHMVKTAIAILLPEGIPILANVNNSVARSSWFIPMKDYEIPALQLLRFFQYFKWTSVGIVSIRTNFNKTMSSKEKFLWTAMITSYPTLCSFYQTVNVKNVNDTQTVINQLKITSSKTKVILLTGDKTEQFNFLISVGEALLFNLTWIMSEIFDVTYGLHANIVEGLFVWSHAMDGRIDKVTDHYIQEDLTIPLFFNEDIFLRKYRDRFGKLTYRQLLDDPQRFAAYQSSFVAADIIGRKSSPAKESSISVYHRDLYIYYLKHLQIYFRNYFKQGNPRIYRNFFHDWSTGMIWPGGAQVAPKSQCFIIVCPPGTEPRLEQFLSQQNKWKQEFAWICRPCKENFVKINHGYDSCKKCTNYLTPNAEKTKCVNSYKRVFLNYSDVETAIIFSIAGFSLFLIIITIVLFVYYKSTPIVKSSNIPISMVQLCAFLFINILVPLLYCSEPNVIICTARPVVIGECFSLIICIAITKCQRILSVFNARVMVTKKQIRIGKSVELLIVMVVMLIHWVLLVVTFSSTPGKDVTRFKASDKYNEVYCNTDIHVQVQIAYIFLLLLFANIQAFRGRNLPQNFNEAFQIVYATLTSNLCLTVFFPLYYSQGTEKSKSFTTVLLLSLTSCILFLLLYVPKVFVILVAPDRNTRKAFQKITMENMQNKVKKRTVQDDE